MDGVVVKRVRSSQERVQRHLGLPFATHVYRCSITYKPRKPGAQARDDIQLCLCVDWVSSCMMGNSSAGLSVCRRKENWWTSSFSA